MVILGCATFATAGRQLKTPDWLSNRFFFDASLGIAVNVSSITAAMLTLSLAVATRFTETLDKAGNGEQRSVQQFRQIVP